MSRDVIQGLVDRWIAGWNAHDAAAVAACYSHDAVSRDVGRATAEPGREAIQNAIQDYLTAFPDLTAAVSRLGTDGDTAYVEWHSSGTQTGPLLMLPPSGKVVQIDGCNVLRVGSEGLFITEISYWDVAGLLVQVGLLPDPAAHAAPA